MKRYTMGVIFMLPAITIPGLAFWGGDWRQQRRGGDVLLRFSRNSCWGEAKRLRVTSGIGGRRPELSSSGGTTVPA
ncbi:hypothetical protein NL676_016728 [Syzygium grande]|nr:hypothetical protein NL676_016728 [Syzygium grande]